MPSVDDRVVQLTFENAKFEKGVSTSMNTLDKLDAKIKSGVSGTALLTLGSAAEKVAGKFSVLEIAGITAISNIANKAVDAGEKILKSLTIDQVTAGWNKYAQKTSAVQTIMAATAKDIGTMFKDSDEQMEYVSNQLEKLNWFTDETSYNFLDMVNNIGKFTSNNIGLEESVTAMQGISTWAAISGATVQQAGQAMYNLSQAMSVGSLKLMDWKSIENANMGTYEFKQMAIEAAVAAGTLEKKADGMYHVIGMGSDHVFNAAKGFRDYLKDDWLTSKVLMNTLDQYGRATNKIYEIAEKTGKTATEIVGTGGLLEKFQEGTLDLRHLAKIAGVSVEEVDEYVQDLQNDFSLLASTEFDLGLRAFRAAQEAKTFQEAIEATKDAVSTGWMNTFELLFGNYKEAKKLWTGLAEELYTIFAEPGNRRNEILSFWHTGIDGASGYEMALEGVSNIWNSLKDIGGAVGNAFHSVFPQLEVKDAAQNLLNITEKFRDFSSRMRNFVSGFTGSDTVEEFAETLGLGDLDGEAAVANATKTVDEVYSAIEELVDQKANEVIRGDYGNGDYRKDVLEGAGYSYHLIQNRVNELLNNGFRYAIADGDYQKMAELLGLAFGEQAEAIEEVTENGEEAVAVGEKAVPLTEKIFNTLQGAFAVVDLVKTAFSAFKQTFIDPIIASIPGVLSSILSRTSEWGKSITAWVQKLKDENTILETFQSISEWITKAKDSVEAFFTVLWDRVQKSESFQKLTERFEQFMQSLRTFKTSVVERFTQLLSNLNAQAEKLGFTLPEIAAGGLMDGLLNALDWVFDKLTAIIDFISPAIDWVSDKIGDLLVVLNSLNLNNLIGGKGPLFGISFREMFGTPTEIVNNLLNSIFSLFGAAKDTISPIIGSAVDGTSDFISNLDALAPAVDKVTGVMDSAKNTISTVTESFETVSTAIGNVKDVATGAGDALEPIIDTAGKAAESLGKYIDSSRKAFAPSRSASSQRKNMIRQAEDVVTVGDAVSEAADSIGEAVKDKSIFTKALDILSAVFPAVGLLRSGMNVGKEVAESDSGKALANSITSWFENGGLMDALLTAWNWLKRAGGNFAEFIATMDHGEIYSLISGIMALSALNGLSGVFKSIGGIFSAASNVLTGVTHDVEKIVSSITGVFSNSLKTIKRAQTAKILLGLALVIGVIVGSIWLISTIPVDALWRSVAIVGAIAIYVAVVAGILAGMANKAKETSDYKGVALLLAALGLTVISVAGSIKILEGIKLSWALVGKIALLAAIVTGMVFAVIAISKAGIGSIRAGIGSAIVMLSFAAAVALLAKALEVVARANFTGIGDNLVVILMALGMLALVAKTIGKGGFGRALGLTLMIADIWLIVLALQSLAKVNTAQLLKAIPAFIEIVIAMGVMMAVTQLAGEHAAGAGIGILAMTVSLLIVARALKKLAAIDEGDLKKSTRAVEGILALYALIIAASHIAKGGALIAAGVSFLLLSVAINILYFAIKNIAKLAEINPESFEKARNTIYILLGLFGVFEALSGLAKPGKLVATAVAFGLVLLAIFGVFWLLKSENMSGAVMQKQADALIALIEALLVLVAAIGLIGYAEGSLGAIAKGALAIDLVIADLVLLIGGIGAIVNALNGETAIETGIDILTKIAEFINEYGITFGVVTAACIGLGYLTEVTGPAILIGVGAIDLVVGNLALLFDALSIFADDGENSTATIERGISVATAIGDGIGSFFGAISGAFSREKMERQGEGVESLATSLETASTGIQTFNDAVSELKTNSVDNIATLTEAVSGMSEIGSSFNLEYAENFKQALNAYGPATAAFFKRMESSGVNPVSAERFSSAVAHLSEIAAFGAPGAFDSDQFASFIESLRTYLTSLTSILLVMASESFTIDEAKVDAVVKTGVKLAEIYDSIPETGGLTQKIFGEESLTTFAEDIKNYVKAIKDVNTTITGFEADIEAWGYFVDVGTKFNALLDDIGYIFKGDETGYMSVFAWWGGSTSLETFAQDIADYVEGIIAVNDVLVGLNEKMVYAGSMVGYIKEEKDYEWSDAWDMLVNVGQKMSELYKSLPGYMADEDAGFFERITAFLTRNKDGMATFGQDLGGYIEAMVAVNDEIISSGLTADTLNVDVLDAVASVARSWTDIATDLSATSISTVGTLGKTIGDTKSGFLAGFQNFYNTVTTMDMSLISAAITDMKTIITELIALAGTDITGIDDLTSVTAALGDLGDAFAKAFATSFATNSGALIEIGSGITASIGKGILENSEELTNATSEVSGDGATSATERVGAYELAGLYLISAMALNMIANAVQMWTAGYTVAGQGASGASYRYINFWYAGYYLAKGLIDGMKYQRGAVYYAGVSLANSALKGVTDTAVIQSPSRIATRYGMYIGEGLANGMLGSEGLVTGAASSMTQSTLDSLNSMISYVYDVLSGALDYDMTIRPVLDLSNVRAGAAELNGIFGNQRYALGGNTYIPKVAVGRIESSDTGTSIGTKVELTNNFYVQKMDEGMVDYFVNRINTELGARV